MKKMMNILSALVCAGLLTAGCSQQAAPADTKDEDTVNIKVNVSGVGEIAVTDDGSEPAFGAQSFQSYAADVVPGTEIAMAAKADDSAQFVRWTKDGEFVSADEMIKVTADGDAEYIAVFLGTSGYDGEAVSDVKDAVTIGDVLALPTMGSGWGTDHYVYAFELNNVMYQAVADLDSAAAETLWQLDVEDENYEQKLNELIAPLKITKMINITEQIPSETELESYTGKKFGELFEDGWFCSGWNLEENTAYMVGRYFEFEAGFEGNFGSDFDEEKLAELEIKSMKYTGIGDACYFEE